MNDLNIYLKNEEFNVENPKHWVTDKTKIKIRFDYPLHRPVVLEFKHKGGFTLKDFVHAIHDGYEKIYATEGDPVNASPLMNRATSEGPYGIWGHYFEDLWLESYDMTKKGYYILGIGS